MDLRDYLDILRARWKLITTTTLLGVLAAAIASMLTTPLYKSTASVIVSATDDQQSLSSSYTGTLYAQQLVKSYVKLPASTVVAQSVIDDLGLAMTPIALSGKISVNNPLDTAILEISATDPSPQMAQQLATATTEAFTQRVDELQTLGQDGTTSLVSIDDVTAATVPTAPVSPRTTINLALGFLVGLAIGVGAAVLLETLDTRIKSIEMLQKYFDVPLLGVIGFDPEAPKKPLIAHSEPHAKRAESFRQVRTNLQFVDVDHRPRSLVVTSSVPMEGKTTTAINLAITLAQTGQPVFLIEADLRRPKVADYLGIEGGAGLTDVLVGRATVDELLQPWGSTGNLWVLAAGLLPPNPSELLGSQAMADLIHHLETRATLIIDAPPLLPVTDAAVVTRLAGGAIVVVAANKTRREHLRTAADSIDSVGGRILGLVFNMASTKGPDAHRYGYAYGYDYTGTHGRAFDDHAPVVPAGLGGLPGVNGSSTPTMPRDGTPGGGTPGDGEVRAPAGTGAAGAATPSRPVAAPTAAAPAKAPTAAKAASTAVTAAAPSSAPMAAAPATSTAKTEAAPGQGPNGQSGSAESTRLAEAKRAAEARAAASASASAAPAAPAAPARPSEAVRAPQPPRPAEPVASTVSAPLVRSTPAPPPPPAAAPLAQPAVSPFDSDTVLPGEPWQPPRPRPAFDPLTAPIEEIAREQ